MMQCGRNPAAIRQAMHSMPAAPAARRAWRWLRQGSRCTWRALATAGACVAATAATRLLLRQVVDGVPLVDHVAAVTAPQLKAAVGGRRC